VVIDPEYHYEVVNVETLERNQSSFLWWIRRLLAAYKAQPALGRGGLSFVRGENTKVLAVLRADGDDRLLAVINLSRHAQVAALDLSELAGFTPVDVFGQTRFPVIDRTPYVLTMGPYDYYWLRLENSQAAQAQGPSPAPLTVTGRQARHFCAAEGLSGTAGATHAFSAIISRLVGEGENDIRQVDELVMRTEQGSTSLLLAGVQEPRGDLASRVLLLSRPGSPGPGRPRPFRKGFWPAWSARMARKC
jgi:maltose alpha-D-glucosyltransferase/alpha-amylase